MKPPKSIRSPLTIVGIVSNVLGMTLVSVLLYVGPQFKLPTLAQLTDSIKQIAKTRKMTSNDFIILLGKPCEGLDGTEKGWFGKWQESIVSFPFANNVEFFVGITSYDSGEYVIGITEHRTYRGGLKYLRWNLGRASNGGSLFPFEAYHQYEEERLEFHYSY